MLIRYRYIWFVYKLNYILLCRLSVIDVIIIFKTFHITICEGGTNVDLFSAKLAHWLVASLYALYGLLCFTRRMIRVFNKHNLVAEQYIHLRWQWINLIVVLQNFYMTFILCIWIADYILYGHSEIMSLSIQN